MEGRRFPLPCPNAMRTRFALALGTNLIVLPVQADDVRTGFGYCAPPVPPPCTEQSTTYAVPGQLDLCKDAVQRYVQIVASYRTCLARETERAILQVNEVLDRYRCRSQGGNRCPPVKRLSQQP